MKKLSKLAFLPLGILFGFLLSRAGATTYDYYPKLFLFQDFKLIWVIGTAVIVTALGVLVLRRIASKPIFGDGPISFKGKPYKSSLIPGGLLFGAGWGLAGACPGTALAMIGEGKMGALFTVLGLVLGTYLYGVLQSHKASKTLAAIPRGTSENLRSRIQDVS